MPTFIEGRHFMLNWDNLTLAEILPYYANNIFMAEMDYKAMGLDAGQWAMLVKEAFDSKVVSATVLMVMLDRASVA
jgi:hypothetical protein